MTAQLHTRATLHLQKAAAIPTNYDAGDTIAREDDPNKRGTSLP